MNLSQKYALEQCLSKCLSHKSCNKKEVRMAVRGGGGHNIKKNMHFPSDWWMK